MQALEKVGGHHSFQLKALVALGLAYAHPAMLAAGLTFMTLVPSVMCENSSRSMRPCGLEQACKSHSHFLFSAQEERSIVFEWRLVCENAYIRQLVPLLLLAGDCYAGVGVGSVLYAKAGEVLGRKKALLWGLVTSCLCEFVLFCSASAYFFCATMVVLGASLPGAILFPPLLLTEMMDSGHRDSFYFYLQTFACIGSATSACISYVMFSWRPIVLGSMAAGLLAIILLQRVKESPRYYAANLSRYQKARAVFQRMAETNRESMFDGTLVGEQMNEYNETNGRVEDKSEVPDQTADKSEILEQSVQPAHDYLGAESASDREKDLERGQRCGFVHLCIYRSCRGKTLRMLVACATAGVASGAGTAGIGKFSENLYFDVGARTAAVLAMVVTCGLQTALCGRKCTALVLMLAVAALSGVISAAGFLPSQYVPVAHALLALAGAGLWLVLCLWTLELVPTPVRSLVAGLTLSVAVLGSAVFPALGAVPKGYMMVAAAAVVGLCALAGLPETKTKYLQDFIEELIVSTAPVKPTVRPQRRGPGFSPFNEVQD